MKEKLQETENILHILDEQDIPGFDGQYYEKLLNRAEFNRSSGNDRTAKTAFTVVMLLLIVFNVLTYFANSGQIQASRKSSEIKTAVAAYFPESTH